MSAFIFFSLVVSIFSIPISTFFVILILEDVDEIIVNSSVCAFILIAFLLTVSSMYWLPVFVRFY